MKNTVVFYFHSHFAAPTYLLPLNVIVASTLHAFTPIHVPIPSPSLFQLQIVRTKASFEKNIPTRILVTKSVAANIACVPRLRAEPIRPTLTYIRAHISQVEVYTVQSCTQLAWGDVHSTTTYTTYMWRCTQ